VGSEIKSGVGIQLLIGLNLLVILSGSKSLVESKKWSLIERDLVMVWSEELMESRAMWEGVGMNVRPLSRISE